MNNKIANDLIRYAELVEDGALISPEEMNCASVMRLAAEYLVQPKRTWVGLTPDEIRGISLASGESLFSAIMFTHDKLKEKNTRNGGCL